MVWLLPVPGGPISTKSLPLTAAITADNCDESAGNGQKIFSGEKSWSSRLGFGKAAPDG